MRKRLVAKAEDGAPGGIQTPDPRFRRPMLYSLSYGRVVTLWSLRIHCGNPDFPKPLITNRSLRDSNQRLTRSKPGTLSN
jgi:hypothetical protein